MNLQQRFIEQFVSQEAENRLLEIDPEFSLEDNLVKNIRRISEGEFLVLEIDGMQLKGLSKLSCFQEFSNIDGDAIIFSYFQLEKAFNEYQQLQRQF